MEIMKKTINKIVGIYLISILIYGIFVSFISSTVHIGCDEELYLELAKSFHYSGKFRFNGELVTYNSVLYSILISFVYYLYSPEKILFFMRFLGAIVMCSAVFPIWKLASKVLKNQKDAIIFSGVTLLLPYMFECGYLMQEVLSYPLFVWTVYFLYCSNECDWNNTKWIGLSAIFSVMCFFCKTHLFFIPIIVNVVFLVEICKRERKWKSVLSVFIYDAIYCFLSIVLYILIMSCNDFKNGSNRYIDQFSNLLPITITTIICAVSLSIIIACLFVFCTGIIPVISVLSNHNIFRGSNKYLLRITLYSCIFMVFETVFLSTIPEEGLGAFPHRFLFRYFHMLLPLILMLAVRICEEKKNILGRKSWIMVLLVTLVCVSYFVMIQGKTTQGIVDGFVFLLLENLAKFLMPYSDAIVAAIAGGVVLGLAWFLNKRSKDIRKFVVYGGIVIIIGLGGLNCIQLPFYNNIIAGGKIIQNDSVAIANYLNREGYEYVYYVDPQNGERYPRNFYGYIKQEWQVIDNSEVKDIIKAKEKPVFLAVKDEDITLEGDTSEALSLVNLQTEKLNLYIVDIGKR